MGISRDDLEKMFTDKVRQYMDMGYVIINAHGTSVLRSNIYSIDLYRDEDIIVVAFEAGVNAGKEEHIIIGVYSFKENVNGEYRIPDGEPIFKEEYYEADLFQYEKM